jgi:hypothetical protein
MDGARCHLTEDVRKEFKRQSSDLIIIPGGKTPLLQPLNTHLNRPVKDTVRKSWEDWMLNGQEVNITKPAVNIKYDTI